MKGIELSKRYYVEYGEPMLTEKFPDLVGKLAIGVVGSGSDCFGYDDEVSKDHDYEVGFCIFLPSEEMVDSRAEFRLERAYASLPDTHAGIVRSKVSPVGGRRRGVVRTADFYMARTGTTDGDLSLRQWLTIPEHYLAETVNGEIWRDDLGEFSDIRGKLAFYPDDVMKKKLAGALLMMGQSGQYNYSRLISHGEREAAQLAVAEFVRYTMQAVFLLGGRYMPFYKWRYKAMREMYGVGDIPSQLDYLMTTPNDRDTHAKKLDLIEGISADILSRVKARGFTTMGCDDLERHAYSVNDGIQDNMLRTMNILDGIG